MRFYIILLAYGCLVLSPIAAHVAEAHLTEQTGQKITALLPKNGTLAQASTWPEGVK